MGSGAVWAFLQVTAVDPVLDFSYAQAGAGALHQVVAEFQNLWEVVAGVHVQQFKRHGSWSESAARKLVHHDRILTAGKQQADLIKLASYLAEDVDGFIFKIFKVWGKF